MKKKQLIQMLELVYELASVARREGLLALEEYICTDDEGKGSTLKNRKGKRFLSGEEETYAIYLLCLMIDGYEKERIKQIAENLIKGSHAYGTKKLFMIMFETAILNIQQGENPRYTVENVAALLGINALFECRKFEYEYDENFRENDAHREQKLIAALTDEVQNHIRKIDAVFAKKEAELKALVEKHMQAVKEMHDSDSSFILYKSIMGWLTFAVDEEYWNLFEITIPKNKDDISDKEYSIRTKDGEIPVCESMYKFFDWIVHNQYDIERFMKLTSGSTEDLEKEISFAIDLSSNDHAFSWII